MQNLSSEEIIRRIENGETFEANCDDLSFYIKIESYVPYIGAAIHDGHQFRAEIEDKIYHSAYERWYEEDPWTLKFIENLPIVIAGKDSRYEYDLNRDENEAIYSVAWGKKVWKEILTEDERAISLRKYANFYKVINHLLQKIEKEFGACVVYDIHSYNYKRYDRDLPVFNLGTQLVDRKRHEIVTDHLLKSLAMIQLPNVENITKENDIFVGDGHFAYSINHSFLNTLIFPIEIKKVYCDELTWISFPSVIEAIQKGFEKILPENAALFQKINCR